MAPLTPPLCVLPPSFPRVVLICGIRRDLSSYTPSATLDGNGTCPTRGSFHFLLFALPDDLVFATIEGGNAVGGADSSGVGVYRRRVYLLFVVEVR